MRIIAGIGVLLAAAIVTMTAIWLWPADQPSQAAPVSVGYLKVETLPPATTVNIDGSRWSTPPEIPAGQHTIELLAPGYEPVEYRLEVPVGQTITLRGSLEDKQPPTVSLSGQPTLPDEGTPITVLLDIADEGSGLGQVDFLVDGESLHTETIDGHKSDRIELHIAALAAGLHQLTAVVTDTAGNSERREMYVDVQAVGLPASPVDVMAVELPMPGETLSMETETDSEAVAEPQPAAVPPAPVSPPVVTTPVPVIDRATFYTETVIIPTYGYAAALDTSGPRPRLDANKMTPPQPVAYTALILENDVLRLTVLPELGGRLYQVTDKATGQKLLYNNPVVKPTRWGPEDMNWWLAVGGMEWAYPVHEHGYAWADAWEYSLDETGEGVTLTLSHTDAPTKLQAQVQLFLPAQGRHFTIAPSVTNTGDAPAGAQLWINAAFATGQNQHLDFPATQVKVHSAGESEGMQAGQILPWQPEMTGWGRWQTWFGAFAAPVTTGVITVSSDGQTLLQRSFNPAQTPGVKWFTWGPGGPTGEWEGQPYFEVWGGLTPDFDSYTNIQPGQTKGWQEMWSVHGDN